MKTNNPKKYRLIIILLIVVNLLLIASWWFFNTGNFWRKDHDQRNKKELRKDFFETALGLDSIQKKEFDITNKEHFKRLRKANNEIDSLKLLVRDEVFKSETDEERLNSLFAEIAAKRTTIDTSIYFHFKHLRAFCNPSQTPAFDSLMDGFFKKKEGYSGRKRRGPDRN